MKFFSAGLRLARFCPLRSPQNPDPSFMESKSPRARESPSLLLALPRELRDIIWTLCVRTYTSAGAIRSNHSTTTIAIENGPLVSVLLVNKQVRNEYEKAVSQIMGVIAVDNYVQGGHLCAPILVDRLLHVPNVKLYLLCACIDCDLNMRNLRHCCVEHELAMHAVWVEQFASMFAAPKSFVIRLEVTWPMRTKGAWPVYPWSPDDIFPTRTSSIFPSGLVAVNPLATFALNIRHNTEALLAIPNLTELQVYRLRKPLQLMRSVVLPGWSALEEAQSNDDLFVSWSLARALKEATAEVARYVAPPPISDDGIPLLRSAERRHMIAHRIPSCGWVAGSKDFEGKKADVVLRGSGEHKARTSEA